MGKAMGGVVESGGDPNPLWHAHTGFDWSELTQPEHMMELGGVLEDLGWAGGATSYMAAMTQFASLAPGFATAGRTGAALFDGVAARRDGEGWMLDGVGRHVLDGDRAELCAVVTNAGVFVMCSAVVVTDRAEMADSPWHTADVMISGVRVGERNRSRVDPGRARQIALTGMALTTIGACRRVLDLTGEHHRRTRLGMTDDLNTVVTRARELAYVAAQRIAGCHPDRARAARVARAAACECRSVALRSARGLFSGPTAPGWEKELRLALARAVAADSVRP
jgi:hypothetical protein